MDKFFLEDEEDLVTLPGNSGQIEETGSPIVEDKENETFTLRDEPLTDEELKEMLPPEDREAFGQDEEETNYLRSTLAFTFGIGRALSWGVLENGAAAVIAPFSDQTFKEIRQVYTDYYKGYEGAMAAGELSTIVSPSGLARNVTKKATAEVIKKLGADRVAKTVMPLIPAITKTSAGKKLAGAGQAIAGSKVAATGGKIKNYTFGYGDATQVKGVAGTLLNVGNDVVRGTLQNAIYSGITAEDGDRIDSIIRDTTSLTNLGVITGLSTVTRGVSRVLTKSDKVTETGAEVFENVSEEAAERTTQQIRETGSPTDAGISTVNEGAERIADFNIDNKQVTDSIEENLINRQASQTGEIQDAASDALAARPDQLKLASADALDDQLTGKFDPLYDELKDAPITRAQDKAARQTLTSGRDASVVEQALKQGGIEGENVCLLYTSPSPRDRQKSRMPSSA